MEKDWNRKRIELLLNGDEQARETFIHEFGPAIYTWMYFQVGADEQIATELTSRTLEQAVRNISDFNPAEQTLFAWLKKQARQTRDEGLGHRQMKPQRPWAWSQLPDDVLCGVSRLRCEPLPEIIIDNPFVHEIIQATLTELEQADRELLIHRYNHLDTVEHIAEEMDCPVEDVQSRLYRCRHSFRRVFFQIISKANSGFSESNATAEIETLDMNLEKLLSRTTTYQALDDAKMDSIRHCVLGAIQETELAYSEGASKKQYLLVVIAAALIVLIAGLYLLTREETADAPPPTTTEAPKTVTETQKTTPETSRQQITQDSIDEEELEQIRTLGQNGNLDALLEILKSGQFVKQAAAAYFIGKLADPSAIPLLEQAEAQWYPDSPEDNTFAQAIREILDRFPDAIPDANSIESETEEIQPAKEDQTPQKLPNITGIVSDFVNEPIANIRMQLSENTLFSKIKAGRKIATSETNPNGQYQFSGNYTGAVFLTGRITGQDTASVTRSLWCSEETICIANIGGKPALTGSVFIDGAALSNQTLYLSDTLDIDDASFGQEIRTDQDGNFAFLGVPAGTYYLMNKGLDNRIRRLAMIEMPEQALYNAALNLQTVMVSTDYPAEPNLAALTEATLVYRMDAPDNLNQVQGAIEENGFVLFENVLPGSYVMRIGLDNGVWNQQNVEITDEPKDQIVQVPPVPAETVTLTGRLLGSSPVNLFLTNANQQIHIGITPSADGFYELAKIPADIYSLAAFVAGQLVEFTQVDLQGESEITLDIDPAEIMGFFSPLYVVVTDEVGLILSGSQVWLNREANVLTTSSTGRGAFLTAPSGSYTLSVAHPGYPTQNLEVTLNSASLLTEPNPDNTILVQMGTAKP